MKKYRKPLLCILFATIFIFTVALNVKLGLSFASKLTDIASKTLIFDEEDRIEKISETLHADITSGSVLVHTDDHGGFTGDGMLYMEIQFSDDVFLKEIQFNGCWESFPLSTNITRIVYGSVEESMSYSPRIVDYDYNKLIPTIENGYYFFFDRHSEANDPADDSNVLSRGSCNFTLAIYDKDTRILYYVEYDT